MIVQSVILYGGDSTLSQPLSGYMVLQSASVWCDSTVSQDLSGCDIQSTSMWCGSQPLYGGHSTVSQPLSGYDSTVNLCVVVIESTSVWWS